MSRRALTNYAVAAGVTLALGAAPAWAQADRDRPASDTTRVDDTARQATSSTGEAITDAWILTKVKTKFIGEDALADSDINVDVKNNVVTLKGTVASQAGKARAAEIARTTEGVTRVQNNLVVGVAKNRADDRSETVDRSRAGDPTIAPGADRAAGDIREESREARDEMKDAARDAKESTKDAARDTREAAKEASAEAREEGREAKRDAKESTREGTADAKETAREAGRETSEAVGTTGQAVNDGWITTKVKASFIGVDVLDGSDIDVDTNDHVVTLRGTVVSEAARARAVSLAKQVDGVRSVKDELKIGAKK